MPSVAHLHLSFFGEVVSAQSTRQRASERGVGPAVQLGAVPPVDFNAQQVAETITDQICGRQH